MAKHQEIFDAFVGYWPIQRYRTSWIAELRRLTGGEDTACLLTSVWYPGEANFPEAWSLYRFGDSVRVHQISSSLTNSTTPSTRMSRGNQSPYTEINEDGDRICEWRITVADFLARATTE